MQREPPVSGPWGQNRSECSGNSEVSVSVLEYSRGKAIRGESSEGRCLNGSHWEVLNTRLTWCSL